MTDWKPMRPKMPRNGALLKLFCHGRSPDFLPFVCTGRFNGEQWIGYHGALCLGTVEPLGWQCIH